MSYSVGKGGAEDRWISLFVLSIAYVTRWYCDHSMGKCVNDAQPSLAFASAPNVLAELCESQDGLEKRAPSATVTSIASHRERNRPGVPPALKRRASAVRASAKADPGKPYRQIREA